MRRPAKPVGNDEMSSFDINGVKKSKPQKANLSERVVCVTFFALRGSTVRNEEMTPSDVC